MGPVYVAFDGDNDKWAYGFMKGWKTNERVDFDFQDAHDLDEMTGRAQNEDYVKSKLKERMKSSEALVVIVGERTKNLHKFVRWEIDLALELSLPIIVVNLNNKTQLDSDLCPPILRDACAMHVPLKKEAIKHALSSWPANYRALMLKRGPAVLGATTHPSGIGRWACKRATNHQRSDTAELAIAAPVAYLPNGLLACRAMNQRRNG